jgi:hypothetical protein
LRDDLGDWILRRLRRGVKAQSAKAELDLEQCGVPLPELRHQWELQREAQMSIRAREYESSSAADLVLIFAQMLRLL